MFRNPDDDDAESCGNGCGCTFFCRRTGPEYDETPPAPPQLATLVRQRYRMEGMNDRMIAMFEYMVRRGLISDVINDLDD